MSAPTAEVAQPALRPGAPVRTGSPSWRLAGGRLYLALAGAALVVAALTLLIPSTPSYDPWAWLVWGREIAHLNLQTTGGPTWKPLPVIFTTVFSLFGGAAPDLWLVVARAGAIVAVGMSFKITWRIARGLIGELIDGAGRGLLVLLPVVFAASVAAASLINSRGFVTDNALGYSEGLMTALVLIAVDRHLDGARRQAFVIGFFAALDRPELWALWGPYGLYLWWKDRGARWLVGSLFILIPVLWFGPEYWGSGHFFRGVSRAQHVRSNSAALAKCPFCTELRKHAWPRVMFRIKAVAVLAVLAAATGLWRTRQRWWRGRMLTPGVLARLVLVVLGTVGWLWWIGIAVLTQAGFSGNDRYLVLGSALISIAGGVAWGWGAAALAAWGRRRAQAHPLSRLEAANLAAVLLALVVLIGAPPWIGPSIIDVPATHRALVYQAHLREDMAAVVTRLGRRSILACGRVMTEGFQVPMLAWNLDVHTVRVEAPPTEPGAGTPPNVVFQNRAQRHAKLLPIIRPWHVNYSLVAHRRTFRVYMDCAAKAAA